MERHSWFLPGGGRSAWRLGLALPPERHRGRHAGRGAVFGRQTLAVWSRGAYDARSRHEALSILADDSLQGRMAGSPGSDKAAAIIAGVMKNIGLEPAGDSGYFQREDRRRSERRRHPTR